MFVFLYLFDCANVVYQAHLKFQLSFLRAHTLKKFCELIYFSFVS